MMSVSKYLKNIWIFINPFIVFRVAKGFFRAFVLKKNTLRLIELFPTFSCQLHCQMCSVEKYKHELKNKKKIDRSDYEKFAKDAAKMGAWVITILGGEPLLFQELSDVIAIFRKEHFFINLVSNGHLASKEVLTDLKKAGLNAIYFSLESLTKEVNDSIRGEGTYDKVMESIEAAKDVGLITGLGAVVFPGKLDDALEIIKYCHRNGMNASGGQVAPVGKAESYSILSEKENSELRKWLKKYPRLTYDWVFSYFLKSRCPSGKEKIGLTCYGDVIACSLNPLSFGNIQEEPLQKIWRRMEKFSMFAKDYDGCLAAEDREYIEKYLLPMQQSAIYPVSYKNHAAISPASEPEMFSQQVQQ